MSREPTADTADESNRRSNWPRRTLLRAAGVGVAVPALGSAATAGGGSDSESDAGGQGSDDDARPPRIHPQFGYSGTADEEIPDALSPDATVELHTEEAKIDDSNLPEVTVEFGAFHFRPVGLQVEPGAVVAFEFVTPEHTATAYHPGQERQLRVPPEVPAFSSSVNELGGFWLYRFEQEGVYDLFCAPHEWAGMGMRIVVGDSPGAVVREQGRPPLPLTAALLGTGLPPEESAEPDVGHPKVAPEYIVENGPIFVGDTPAEDVLDIGLSVTLTPPAPASE
jgi:plastocyanin